MKMMRGDGHLTRVARTKSNMFLVKCRLQKGLDNFDAALLTDNDPPVFSNASSVLQVRLNESITITLNAVDPDGTNVTYFFRGDLETDPNASINQESKN